MKGRQNGTCNMSSCTTNRPATWLNYGNNLYYCPSCAKRLNKDPLNIRDAMELFGHNLCLAPMKPINIEDK